MSRSEPLADAGLRLRRPGRGGTVVVAVALAAGLVLAGLGTFDYVQSEFGGTTLVVLTYPSLFGGACGGSPAFSTVFGEFASAHDVRFDVECPPGTAYSWLAAESGAPTADLVIGLDEITAPQAEAAGFLVPYAPPALANVSPALVTELSPDRAAVPYEYGYLAIDYNESFYRATSGAVVNFTFPELTQKSWAPNLLLEDPQTDITGEEFLVWQIEYYEQLLHQNWTAFWTAMPSGDPPLSDSWGDAYAQFFYEGPEQMLVSYSTDPACGADPACAPYPGASSAFNATVSSWNGTEYGWKTIYGVGIVNGTRHLALDEAFENWLLSGTAQAEIPTNEWEYPANTSVALPGYFSAAVPPGSIVALNDGTTPAAVGASIAGWVATWFSLTSGHG